MGSKYEHTAQVFKALCDANRLMILEQLQSGPKCACHILEALNVTQPTLSHHMKILCESGLVHCEKTGRWIHYSLNPQGAQDTQTLLVQLVTPSKEQAVLGDC